MVGDLLVNVMRAAKNAVSAPRPGKRPLVQMEALLVALYVHRNEISEWTVEETKESFNRMLAMPSFTDSARYAVSGVDNVRRRLNAAIEAFSSNAHGD
jgi:hypothetical protein